LPGILQPIYRQSSVLPSPEKVRLNERATSRYRCAIGNYREVISFRIPCFGKTRIFTTKTLQARLTKDYSKDTKSWLFSFVSFVQPPSAVVVLKTGELKN